MSQQINLFNPVFMRQGKYFSAVTMLQALAMIIVGMLLFYFYAVHQVQSLTSQLAETKKRYVDGQAKLQRYTAEFSPEEANRLMDSKVSEAEEKLAAQSHLLEILKNGALGNVSGYSEYMGAFARQAVSGLWLSSFTIVGDGTQISISGSVLSPELLPVYVGKLGQEPSMHGKSFASLQMRRRNDSNAIEFTLLSAGAKR